MSADHIFIGTPTLNGFMAGDYVASLAGTLNDLHARGIPTTYRTVDGPDAPTQRDMLAGEFLSSPCTHLLLINPDMSFDGELCATLLARRVPVVGVAYASRSVDLARLKAQLETRAFEAAFPLAHDWVVRLIAGSITVEAGFGRVDALGPGFLLIERACLERVAASVPGYLGPIGGRRLPALFRDMRCGGAVWTQDYVFCEHWRALGGEVWVYPAANARRITEARFGVPFGATVGASQALAGQPDRPMRPLRPAPRAETI
jgi:hypothetical protein